MSLSEHTPIDTLKKGLASLKIINELAELAEASEIMESDKDLEEKYRKAIEILEDLENDNRYFIVAYIGTHPMGKLTGLVDITTNGQYLNRALTIENIKEQNSELSSVVITNVIEMTKEDFDSWSVMSACEAV